MSYRLSSVMNSVKTLHIPMKYPIAFFIAIASCQAYATPTGFGTFTRDSSPKAGSVASGRYTTPTGATGAYTVSAGTSNGYSGRVFTVGDNGIEIRNVFNTNIANDSFTYTFSITPDDNTAIHTVKIGQASYATSGNSEVARQTLAFTKNSQINTAAKATVRNNPSVSYYYEAMGDYFMGEREGNTSTFTYKNSIDSPQLRANNANKLYFYRLDFLNGTNLGGNRFTPSTNNNGEVSITSGGRGVLPNSPTFINILKSTSTNPNNQSTYNPLTTGDEIGNGTNYVSYGIENSQSKYVIAIRNANSVTLTYEGIMNGSNGIAGNIIGETYNEWISFGVESEPLYVFSGTVFNDNGGINDLNADASIIGGIYDNNRYFNGVWDHIPSTSPEQGIPDSTIRLVDNCTNPTKEYDRKTIVAADAGSYQFVLLPTDIDNSAKPGCIIETRSNANFPIRTTSATKPITFNASNYNYLDNNFGRVIDKNAALVLEKEQAANDCSITSLIDPSLAYSKAPLSTSDTGAGASIRPGMCIAYKITATNRANLEINKVVIADTLQKRDLNNPSGSKVTSFLNLPERTSNPSKAYNDNVNYRENGTIVTSEFDIPKKKNQVFYFNTKYGSSQSNP